MQSSPPPHPGAEYGVEERDARRLPGQGITIRIFPTYMFLLFLFREASSSSPRSVPLICRENRDTLLWVPRGCRSDSGHRTPAAWTPSLAELPDHAVSFSWFAGKKQSNTSGILAGR